MASRRLPRLTLACFARRLRSMGSFACMELARRGAKVAGFDRFEPPHAFGSHSGSTRIYREAYAEGPDYVPLVKHAGRLWDAYGEEAGGPLLERCGMLSMGPPDSWVIAGVLSSATSQRVCVEQLNADEIRKRYPAFDPQHRLHHAQVRGVADLSRRHPVAGARLSLRPGVDQQRTAVGSDDPCRLAGF